ncbi:hypothetical protein [Acaryochloris marina]|uniref:Uncharacterized protein n=1 Tax=Acaryochloris marina (strain MBIC 11017) TaxID=329726 RepID=A8ZR25_ACAM1|nr:hypothetical protein [Acaryochloris marina]ABW33461.1 hypothetical protein AM1_H0111 [Acaryochloris marina MBIC11017]
MKQPKFDENSSDQETFAPFILDNCMNSEWKDVRLIFGEWEWFEENFGTETFDGYYFNGYGLQGLVMAVRLDANLDVEPETIHYNSEGDICNIHFTEMAEAITTANLASEMIKDKAQLKRAIQVARENGFED